VPNDQLTLLSGVAYRGRSIAGPRLQGLLALLADDLRTGASTSRLVERLWSDELPENPTKALQILVSRARSQLGTEIVAKTATGYRLTLPEDRVDASAVLLSASASARHARAGDHAAALAHAEAGLRWWDGPPDDAAAGDPLATLRAERASTYRSLIRSRALALSRLGRHAEAIAPLTELVRQRPRDEELMLELLRSEAAATGPAAALGRYEQYRRSLRDELGTDPGPALQAGYQQLLRGETPVVRHGIPYEPNPLLGREDDIAAVMELLATARVTSIVGPGGLGKTRLAQAVSRRAEHRVVRLVALAGVSADGDVAGEVAAALGVGEAGRSPVGPVAASGDPVTGIVHALGAGPVLLVLDNCEQVIDGVAELVRRLVSAVPDLRVLTTSRSPLGLSSESVFLLPELSLATATELFTQRARAARPGVELPTEAVAELCRHLDGLPLAVELAAARVRTMSVAEIGRRLQDRFGLLRGGPRDAPQRHHTLQAVVDWSWRLLAPAGQAAMRTLSVFPDGFTMDAAEHVLEGGASGILEHLVDHSLLKVVETPAGARFRMLETVREFSAARREEAGDAARAVDGFLAWARDLGLAYHDAPFGAEPYEPVKLIRAEQDNLMQAMRYGLAKSDGPTVAATGAVLGALWYVESNFTRLGVLAGSTGWLLSHYRPEPRFVEVTRSTLTLAAAYGFLAEGPRATRSLVALRRLPTAPPDTIGRAAAYLILATLEGEAALRRLCDSDEPLVAAVANAVVTYQFETEGDLAAALRAAHRALDVLENQDATWALALAHGRIAELCMQSEQSAEARRHVLAAMPIAEKMESWADVVGMRWWLVLSNLQLGAVDEAEHWLDQAVPNQVEVQVSEFTYGLGVRAEIQLARGEVEAGLDLWRRAVDRMRDADDPLLEPWLLEAKAVTVVAHAQHGRLDPVEEIAVEFPARASAMLTRPGVRPFLAELPICGSLLLALAMMDLHRGEKGTAVRLIALAERLRFLRLFQPTMSPARARRAATQADRAAYDEAVSSYAAMASDELRAAALALLAER
jgi:predicted ATPase/DNA-binding SARP family transcriptional activator